MPPHMVSSREYMIFYERRDLWMRDEGGWLPIYRQNARISASAGGPLDSLFFHSRLQGCSLVGAPDSMHPAFSHGTLSIKLARNFALTTHSNKSIF